MCTSSCRLEISRLASGRHAAAIIFRIALAALLVGNAKARVNPTQYDVDLFEGPGVPRGDTT